MGRKIAGALLIAALASTPVRAQSAGGSNCEFHLWPAAGVTTLTEGWVWNNVQNSAYTNRGERRLPPEPLGPADQLRIVAAADPASLLGLAGARIVPHPSPAAAVLGRRTDSTAACYAELEIAKIFYDKSALAGRELRALFVFRRFGAGSVSERRFTTFAATPLMLFPAKSQAGAAAAQDELAAALATDVRKFTAYAMAAATRRR